MQLALIAMAGALGVIARYIVSLGVTRLVGGAFPFATVLINVMGSFFIGVLYAAWSERAILSDTWSIALIVGLMGGFTTFSSFSLETVRMLEGGQWGLATANVLVSVALCLGATALGLHLARTF